MPDAPAPSAIDGYATPRMGDLARAVESIAPEAQVPQLLALFHQREDLLAVPLLDGQGRYRGIVSRRAFMSFMSRSYTRDIYARRTVADLVSAMPELAAAPVSPAPDERIDRVLIDYLARDPGMRYDALPVIDGDGIVGVAAIADMMLSLSESQGKLLGAMRALSDRLKQEVALAAQVQRQLLPPAEIDLPGVQGLATLLTSSEVGGDYYDCYMVDGRYAVLLIGDVSGHGVAAGTLVGAVTAGVNMLAAAGERSPVRILERLNAVLLETARQTLYMSFFAACLDTSTGQLGYANAGHQFPYLYRAMLGSLEMLEAGGLPLGKSERAEYPEARTEMDLGDRLFLYTDGLLEELDATEEPFGYERLEALLNAHGGGSLEALRDAALEALARHAGKAFFEDDVTLFSVEFRERPLHAAAETAEKAPELNQLGLVSLPEAWYRANPAPISPYLSRQNLVFLAETGFSDLLPRLARDGIRRVLPRHQPVIQRLGWDRLANQHQAQPACDLAAFIGGHGAGWRDFVLSHSDDKAFVIEECGGFMEEAGIGPEHLDPVLLAIDELLENGLYAAPKDGKGVPLHPKGGRRALAAGESLALSLAVKDGLLGLSVADGWGTLTPAVFLERLARHAQGEGLIAGQGGAGFYLLWRLSSYLQLRVLPQRRTQITALFELGRPVDADADKGFQFLFHSEVHEAACHVFPNPAHPSGNLG
jgi:serine phosphatase RsbU (regulator of sigma subunit)